MSELAGSRLWHVGRGRAKARGRLPPARRRHLLVLRGPGCRRRVCGRSRPNTSGPRPAHGTARVSKRTSPRLRREVHLPDAPGGHPERPRYLSDLRHGARARGRHARGRSQPRARRSRASIFLDPPLEHRRLRGGDERPPPGHAGAARARLGAPADRARPRGAGGRLWGGLPFFASVALRSILTGKLNMFTLIALGTGAAFVVQPRRHGLPRTHPSRWIPYTKGRAFGLFSEAVRPSSPPSRSSARCSSSARAIGPRVRSGSCSGCHLPPRGVSATTEGKRTFLSPMSASAIVSAFDRARRFRSRRRRPRGS